MKYKHDDDHGSLGGYGLTNPPRTADGKTAGCMHAAGRMLYAYSQCYMLFQKLGYPSNILFEDLFKDLLLEFNACCDEAEEEFRQLRSAEGEDFCKDAVEFLCGADEEREQVERQLQAAGIIEDPDTDGGLLG